MCSGSQVFVSSKGRQGTLAGVQVYCCRHGGPTEQKPYHLGGGRIWVSGPSVLSSTLPKAGLREYLGECYRGYYRGH